MSEQQRRAVPDEVLEFAAKVAAWMIEHGVTEIQLVIAGRTPTLRVTG